MTAMARQVLDSGLMTDTRPRVKYMLPDLRPIVVIVDHDEVPRSIVDFEVRRGDPLWDSAEQRPGTDRRFVYATRAVGL